MALCKRRGFIYQASEIYGGINGFWDYGPLGTLLKRNVREAWWQDVVMNPCAGKVGPFGEAVRIVAVDTCIIQHPKVWEASGHVAGFNDPMQTCRQCKKLFRADHVQDMLSESEWVRSLAELVGADVTSAQPIRVDTAALGKWASAKGRKLAPGLPLVRTFPPAMAALTQCVTAAPDQQLPFRELLTLLVSVNLAETGPVVPCPNCGGDLTEPRQFNLMFETYTGAVRDDANKTFLRPETAQGIFTNFKNVLDTTRVRVPFGIAQTGKAFRNEVTPRNFTFRSREFEQMEIEFFCHPDQARAWYQFWRDWRVKWWEGLGLKGENLQLREHDRDELAHYARDGAGTSDIEYRFPFTAPGFGELEGVAHRTDFDLRQHKQHSGAKIDYFDQDRGPLGGNGLPKGEWYLPNVIEPSAGLDRGVLAILCEAYTRDESRPSPEIMRFHPRVAPIKAAVFPLVNKDGMPEVAEKLHAELVRRFGRAGLIETDAKQSIGKRYARMDEAGCPFCLTIDGDTLVNQKVTVRDRDTGTQTHVDISQAAEFLAQRLEV
ncbi:MAG: glycine--tRNA ligase [Planctomycetota bacterium]